MLAFLAFFLGAGFLGWGLLFMFVVFMFVALEFESIGGGFLVLVGLTLISVPLLSNYDFNYLEFVRTHWGEIFTGVFYYLVLGAVYSVVKWYIRSNQKEAQNTFRKLHKKYLNTPKPAFLEDNEEYTFQDFLKYNPISWDSYNPMKNKYRITVWMMYWPFDAVWLILHDFIKQIWSIIYDNLINIYSAITKYAIKRAIGGE